MRRIGLRGCVNWRNKVVKGEKGNILSRYTLIAVVFAQPKILKGVDLCVVNTSKQYLVIWTIF